MVNYSSIKGKVLPNSALAKKNKGEIKNFFATGVSVVIHPNNPFVPCSHLNVRYFETDKKDKWWFGGGYDLTPYFVFKDDIKLWHDNTKKTCDNYDKRFYGNFSKQCDEYFYIEHRKEKRGVGGIFYDNLNKNDKEFYKNFSRDVAFTYLDSYLNIIKRRNKKKYSKAHLNMNGEEVVTPFWNLINGPFSDIIYHTGQVVAFRRISGNPINPGVNVFVGQVMS